MVNSQLTDWNSTQKYFRFYLTHLIKNETDLVKKIILDRNQMFKTINYNCNFTTMEDCKYKYPVPLIYVLMLMEIFIVIYFEESFKLSGDSIHYHNGFVNIMTNELYRMISNIKDDIDFVNSTRQQKQTIIKILECIIDRINQCYYL